MNNVFRNTFGRNIFEEKYLGKGRTWNTWEEHSQVLVKEVCSDILRKEEVEYLTKFHSEMKFIAGGRYLYYTGRPNKFYNNCFLLKAENDTRQDWADLTHRAISCLMTGGGIGIDYSVYRAKGTIINRTGGNASGPISVMHMINEIGRNVMQGGSRRSAIYGSLNWKHGDAKQLIHEKDWGKQKINGAFSSDGSEFTNKKAKENNFDYHCPLDSTNISLNYDNDFLLESFVPDYLDRDTTLLFIEKHYQDGLFLEPQNIPETFLDNCKMALQNGEPGFSFNFFRKEKETLRNAPVSGNTKVLTKNGYKRVFDVVGKPITLWTGFRWAHNVVFNLTKKNSELVKVELSNGRTLVCSPEHPFISKNFIGKGKDKKVELARVAAIDLKKGQKISSSLPEILTTGYNSKDYALGFVLGDGSIKNKNGEISFHTETKRCCFEETCKTLSAKIVSKDNRAYFKTEFNNKLELLNVDVLSCSFIAGLFDADGCYTRKLLRLSSSDKKLLEKVSESLDFWGIKSVVRVDGKSSFKPENLCYTLLVFSESLKTFGDKIPTKRIKIDSELKQFRTSEIRVLNVEKLDYFEDVFCCDVKLEEHSFMAEGVVISNCTEVTSEDDSDVCNLGSLNMSRFNSIEEWRLAVRLGSKFLVCGTLKADLPYEKIYKVREKNRRLGLGIMGIHEWLLKRGYRYEMNDELRQWLQIYKIESENAANELCDSLSISRPVAYRAIAPTGTIGILAGTTTGIEPIFTTAYKRRYLKGRVWHYEYVVDATAHMLVDEYSLDPYSIETSLSLSNDFERRIKFQADVQDYVDMSISSTINMPEWGSEYNNEDLVEKFAKVLLKYSPRLRGFTCYPNGARGGQPLTEVDYLDAIKNRGEVFQEKFIDVCDITNKGGTCGI